LPSWPPGWERDLKRVLITGMSGTGKSTVLAALASRGFKIVDTDYGDWHEDVNGDWVWREDRVQELLSIEDAEVLVITGCVSNQHKFYPRLDHVVLLSAPAAVIVARLAARTNNPYGKDPAELAEILDNLATVEPLLRRRATLEVDTSAPVDQVVAAILAHVEPSGSD
jgi:adenylate kinase family enzyme